MVNVSEQLEALDGTSMVRQLSANEMMSKATNERKAGHMNVFLNGNQFHPAHETLQSVLDDRKLLDTAFFALDKIPQARKGGK
jgi:hypothetical protein